MVFSGDQYLMKLFHYKDRYFIYDTLSANLNELNEHILSFIPMDQLLSTRLDAKSINSLIKAGLLTPYQNPKKIQTPLIHKSTRLISWLSRFKKSYLIFITLSEKCNFDCTYCSLKYYPNEIKTEMSAKNAIEVIKAIISKNKKREYAVLFSGGEPLLYFRKIIEVITAIRMSYPDTSILFKITTNGSLLTDEVIQDIVKYNIDLAISHDGPHELHSSNRFLKSGKDCFKQLEDSITSIRNYYPDYFRNKVKILGVHKDFKSLVSQHIYYKENDLPKALSTPCIDDLNRYNTINYKEVLDSGILEKLQESLQNGNNNSSSKYGMSIFPGIVSFMKRNIYEGKDRYKQHIKLGCDPYLDRVAVNCDGTVSYCDSIKSRCHHDSIVSKSNKIRLQKDMKCLYDYINKECAICWARNSCTICMAHILDRDGFVSTDILRDIYCPQYRKHLYNTIMLTIAIQIDYPYIINSLRTNNKKSTLIDNT